MPLLLYLYSGFLSSSFSIEAHSKVTDVSGHFLAASLLDPRPSLRKLRSFCCCLCPALGFRTSCFLGKSVFREVNKNNWYLHGLRNDAYKSRPCSFPFLTDQSMSYMLSINIHTWENKALFDPTLICKVVLTTLKVFCVSFVSGEILALLADYVSF